MNDTDGNAEVHTAHRQHMVLRYIIDDFPKGEPFDPAFTWVQLLRLKTTMIRHWRLEEQHLYPALRESADETARTQAGHFRERMRTLLEEFLAFCAQWYDAGAIAENQRFFILEWTMLRDALLHQLEAEERRLFPLIRACNAD